MNEQDQAAFEKWWYLPLQMSKDANGKYDKDMLKHKDKGKSNARDGWQAALSHERQRSAKLLEALKVINWHMSDDGSKDPDEVYDISTAALKEYYASGEGER